MKPASFEVVLKRFEAPDETRVLEKGKFEIVRLGGMTRGDLLQVFIAEGGISTPLSRTYVYRRCRYVKVDVEFEVVGRPPRDADGRVTLIESDDGLIKQISRPYLAWSVLD